MGRGYRDVVDCWELFRAKKVGMRAYQDSRASGEGNKYYVSEDEFKLLLELTKQYYMYWLAFEDVDDSEKYKEHRLRKWAGEKLEDDIEKEFDEHMDKDGFGMVL